MAVTIHDVAKKAGVSHTTVSWVVHDDKRITAETKKKVLQAIKDLNYHPNQAARSLVQGNPNALAIVSKMFSTNFEQEILKGVEDVFFVRNLDLLFNLYSTAGIRKKKNSHLEGILYGQKASHVILLNLKPDEKLLEEYQKKNIPVVLVEEEMPQTHYIKMNNRKGAFIATDFLIQKGRKKIACISGTTSAEEPGLSPFERLQGYQEALIQAGIPYQKELVVEVQKYYFEEGQSTLASLLEKGHEIDAIFCAAGDVVALGAMNEAIKRGIRVPQDLAIIGYDDTYASSLTSPSLTTMRQPLADLGKKALEICLQSKGKKSNENLKQIVLEPELVIRGST